MRLAGVLVVLFVLALTFLAACGDGGGEPAPTSTAPAPSPSPVETPFEGGREPVEKEVPSPQVAYLANVRTEEQELFDRVIFEFEGGSTGYRFQYVEPPIIEDPSGLPVEVGGNAFLQVVFFSASGVDLSEATPRITCCATEPQTGLTALVDLRKTGDFEATLSWVLGLDAEVDFQVTELSDPYRIVIDVGHP